MKFSGQIELFSHVTFLDKLLFTKHLSIMLKSGITIVEALDILVQQTSSQAFKKVVTAISNDIKDGKTFSKSLSHYPKVFSPLFISLIEVGETSGTLDENLSYLSSQLAKDYSFRKKVKGLMLYPMIVLSAAGVVGLSVGIFALPKLIDLFKDFTVQLPLSTRVLLFGATIMRDYGILICLVLVGGIIGFRLLVQRPQVKPLWEYILLQMPLFGKIIQNAELTTIFRSLGIMLKSGLPITSALEITERITTNIVFSSYVKHMLQAISKGKSLSAELNAGNYKRIPLIAIKMIEVGERTGKLDQTLLYLGDFFEDEVDDATRNITTVLEPVLLLLIGGLVGFVAMAIISPIYALTGSIGK